MERAAGGHCGSTPRGDFSEVTARRAHRRAKHVGWHFLYAARQLGWDVRVHDMEEAYRGATLVRRVNWWLRGRLPTRFQAGVQRGGRRLCARVSS